MTSFQGMGILCFYSNGFFQGHIIDKITNESPYSLAGKLAPDYIDPKHNDCMDKQDFYKVLIQTHDSHCSTISLLVRRPKENDAAGLFTHENDSEFNEGYTLTFSTHHFLTGEQAFKLQEKYFNRLEQDVTVCIGDILIEKQE